MHVPKGRQIAKKMGVQVIGFVGLLIQAVRREILDKQSAVENSLYLSVSLRREVQEVLESF